MNRKIRPTRFLRWSGALLIWLATAAQYQVSATDNSPAVLQETFKKSYYYESIGDLKNAIAVINPLAASASNSHLVQVRLGYLWLTSGQLANAEFHYQEALKLAPQSITPALGLMRIYNTLLRFDKTETLAYRVLKNDLHNYYTNVYLAYALRMKNKHDLAYQVVRRMLALYPDDVTFLSEYALLKFSDKAYTETHEVVGHILMLDPENITAKELHYQLLKTPATRQ